MIKIVGGIKTCFLLGCTTDSPRALRRPKAIKPSCQNIISITQNMIRPNQYIIIPILNIISPIQNSDLLSKLQPSLKPPPMPLFFGKNKGIRDAGSTADFRILLKSLKF